MIQNLMRLINWLISWIQHMIIRRTGPIITLDTGKRVVQGRQIAEGGFSLVFEATESLDDSQRSYNRNKKFALKRVHCPDNDLLQACRNEANVHRSVQHPNVMPLLGMAFQQHDCYMLFPYCNQTLRDVVNERNPLLTGKNKSKYSNISIANSAPWEDVTALHLFLRICAGVLALHEQGYTHRDIKLENVLLLDDSSPPSGHSTKQSLLQQPVLMDFGSAGPLQRTLFNRRDVLSVVDEAAQHTTLPYRPPELFEGGLQVGDIIDYRAVDVWSLGCTLHALLYGASPFECEFRTREGICIVACSHLAVLGNIPTPKPPIDAWYSPTIRIELLEPMLTQDRNKRPTLSTVIATVEKLIEVNGGRVERNLINFMANEENDTESDGIALMSRVV